MADNLIPGPDGDALGYMLGFAATLTADPGKYDVSSADALMITTAVNEFQDAWLAIQVPSGKNKVTVDIKDEKRAAAEEVVRLFASQIRVNAGISDSDKEELGIIPPGGTRTPIPVPETVPLLSYMGTTPDGSMTLRFSDSSTPDSRGKPYGYQSLQLFRVISADQADDPADASFYGLFTRNPATVGFNSGDNGKWCTFFARWVNTKGQAGPWSNPLPVPIASVSAEAA